MEDNIGSRLKVWRQAIGLTQHDFSERVGLHIGVLKKYELGKNTPGGEALASIAKTGVNLNWLLTGEGNMRNKEEKAAAPETAVTSPDIPPELEPFRRQLEAIAKLVTDIPDPEKRAALMAEFSTRALKTRNKWPS